MRMHLVLGTAVFILAAASPVASDTLPASASTNRGTTTIVLEADPGVSPTAFDSIAAEVIRTALEDADYRVVERGRAAPTADATESFPPGSGATLRLRYGLRQTGPWIHLTVTVSDPRSGDVISSEVARDRAGLTLLDTLARISGTSVDRVTRHLAGAAEESAGSRVSLDDTELLPRIGLTVEVEGADPDSEDPPWLRAAALARLAELDGVRMIPIETQNVSPSPAALHAAETPLAIHLLLRPLPDDRWSVSASVVEPDADPAAPMGILEEFSFEIAVDRLGLFLTAPEFAELARRVARHTERAVPATEVIIRSNGPVTLSGLPGMGDVDSGDDSEVRVIVRRYRSYDVTVSRPRHIAASRTIVSDAKRIVVEVPLEPYPRHAAGMALRALAFPSLQYSRYNAATTRMVTIGVTSYFFGFTPVSLTSGWDFELPGMRHGLTEFELGVQQLVGARDAAHRAALGVAGTMRLVHGEDVSPGFDPIVPWTLRLSLGWEWRLGPSLVLSQRLSSDLFVPLRKAFLVYSPWQWDAGIVVGQLPVYSAGLRVTW
jgi:hypothetical protein